MDSALAQYASGSGALDDRRLGPDLGTEPGSSDAPKRKRGRPPKDPLKAAAAAAAGAAAPQPAVGPDGEPVKRRRGRPPGSKNRIVKNGAPLVPQVLNVLPGEDVVEKLRELSHAYHRSLCILAANGSLSAATLAQIGPQGQGVGVTLRGHFTILSISGAILHQPEPADQADGGSSAPGSSRRGREQVCFISASLANPTGGVVGGTVAGALEACSLVTVVIGHWEPDPDRPVLAPSLPLAAGAGDESEGKLDVQSLHKMESGAIELALAVPAQQPAAAAMGVPAPLQLLGQYGGWPQGHAPRH